MTEQLPPLMPHDEREERVLQGIKGFSYQWLYALRLMRLLLQGDYDGYRTETIDDYLIWKYAEGERRLSKLVVVQVKARETRQCLMRTTGEVRAILASFTKLCDRRLRSLPLRGVYVEFRIAFNRWPSCSDCQCKTALESMPELGDINNELSAMGAEPQANVRIEPFLSLPIKISELVTELDFLRNDEPALLELLKQNSTAIALIKALVGIIAPLHTKQHRPLTSDELDLNERPQSRRDALNQLRTVLRSAKDRSSLRTRINALMEKVREAEEIASEHLFNAPPLRTSGRPPNAVQAQVAYSEVGQTLLKARLLESHPEHSFWRSSKRFLQKGTTKAILTQSRSELLPLAEYLSAHGSHRNRAHLILSLVRAVEKWSNEGLILTDFQSRGAKEELYLVRPGTTPELVIADMSAFSVETEADKLLTAEWVLGPVVAKAIRQMYFEQHAAGWAIERWNDNVVEALAVSLDGRLPHATQLRSELEHVFEVEQAGFPILALRGFEWVNGGHHRGFEACGY